MVVELEVQSQTLSNTQDLIKPTWNMLKYILLHVQVVRGGQIHSSRPLVCLTFPLPGGLTPLSKPALTSYMPETFCAYIWIQDTIGNQVAARSKQRFMWCCVLGFPVQQD